MNVTQPALAAASREQPLARSVEIDRIRLIVDAYIDYRANRHHNLDIGTLTAMHIILLAIAARLGGKLALMLEAQQSIDAGIGAQVDMPTAPAIAATWPTTGHKLLTSKDR